MYKLILNDYRSHFKSTVKKMWKEITSPIIIIVLDLIFLWTYWNFIDLTMIIPSGITYILAKMYGGKLNKAFFLCPLDIKTRRQYAIESYRLRVIIPSIIFIVLNIIELAMGRYDIWILLIRLIIFECVAISSNVYCQSEHFEDMDREISFTINKYTTMNVWSNLVNMLAIIEAACITSNKFFEISTFSKVLLLGTVAWQVAITIYKVKRFYWKSIMDMELYK